MKKTFAALCGIVLLASCSKGREDPSSPADEQEQTRKFTFAIGTCGGIVGAVVARW